MRIRQIVTVLFAGAALWLVSGCDRGDGQAFSSEADEPYYRQGQQLVKQGRNQEALAAYLKVIAKRGESAPESHLEAGLLYLDQIKDPLAAIYHFRKYLELQPNSRQAIYVKGRIDVAKREFARTLPAQPLENQSERLALIEQVDRLERENEQLRAEIAALHGGVPNPLNRSRATIGDEPPAANPSSAGDARVRPFVPAFSPPPSSATPATAEEESPLTLAPEGPTPAESEPVVRAAPPSSSAPAASVAPVRSPPTKPTPPAGSGRRHTVVKGDTLFSLAQKYYGNRSRWRDIYAANRDQLPSENALRLGMELRIP